MVQVIEPMYRYLRIVVMRLLMLEVVGEVRKRTFIAPADRTDQAVKYIDTDEKFFSLSILETNLGTANDV